MKVGVCISSGGMVHASFAVCLAVLIVTTANAGVPMTVLNAESSLNMVNREQALAQARAQGCTHVFLIDSDMAFPSDALLRLIAAERDIVGCLYARRVHPYATLGRLADPKAQGVAEAVEIGIGCVLVRVSAFDGLRPPYFRCPPVERLDDPAFEGMDLTGIKAGETIDDSVWFSKVMRRAGHKLWVDVPLTLEIGHTGFVTHYVARKAA